MVLVEGDNSTESIFACGRVLDNGDFSTMNCWLGRYDISSSTDDQTSFSGVVFSSLGLGILILLRRKKMNKG